MKQKFDKIRSVHGKLQLPGDKSISHRAVMFSALADGTSKITNLSNSEDVTSTINCFRQLGCVVKMGGEIVKITGCGFKGFTKPAKPLDAGNSGTTARLISGILAAQNFECEVIGDDSLSKRPMKRIIEPLDAMGADIQASEDFTLPLKYIPSIELKALTYELPVASAQVKSAVLLAGLHLDKTSVVVESVPSRNHTEKLLKLKVDRKDSRNHIYVSKADYPAAADYFVPADISSAAFFIVLALLSENSRLRIKNVLLNETRIGILQVLIDMGGDIEIANKQNKNGEDFGDVLVKSSRLHNIEIRESIIPNIIDEIPILTVAGLYAEGDFRIENAKELRYKESDRIKAICENLTQVHPGVEEFADGFAIKKNPSEQTYSSIPAFKSYGDHRIAMAFSVLSMLLPNGGDVEDFDCVKISNPQFLEQLERITG